MTLIEPVRSDGRTEGRAVRVLLAAKEMSQRDLAARTGIDMGTLSRLLNGRLHHRVDLWRQVWIALTSSSEESPE